MPWKPLNYMETDKYLKLPLFVYHWLVIPGRFFNLPTMSLFQWVNVSWLIWQYFFTIIKTISSLSDHKCFHKSGFTLEMIELENMFSLADLRAAETFGNLSYRQILDNISPVTRKSKVHTHTEQEQLYLMLSSNSCQVEMALCNHGDI